MRNISTYNNPSFSRLGGGGTIIGQYAIPISGSIYKLFCFCFLSFIIYIVLHWCICWTSMKTQWRRFSGNNIWISYFIFQTPFAIVPLLYYLLFWMDQSYVCHSVVWISSFKNRNSNNLKSLKNSKFDILVLFESNHRPLNVY